MTYQMLSKATLSIKVLYSTKQKLFRANTIKCNTQYNAPSERAWIAVTHRLSTIGYLVSYRRGTRRKQLRFLCVAFTRGAVRHTVRRTVPSCKLHSDCPADSPSKYANCTANQMTCTKVYSITIHVQVVY